ncbi:MAG: bifunctional lysine ketoglutarate reductase /saccharopine dehydrogenase family protein [Candidatus Cloacimonadales bacterium]|nr:bifunctional lysine ketoglutarate reductase /saccharopine dehydrogenase family protein [Candidatus Cloacimonadales bacterium]
MKTLGIVKETKNKWERRVPLNPQAVKELIEKGFEVIIQPSEIRIYTDDEFEAVGAKISDDLSQCDFVIGVKEIPIPDIIHGIPHLFFSHTIKGQEYNMPMLQYILDNSVTLLDYEKIADEENRRLVFFGEYAGNAGTIDTLHGLGRRLKEHYGLDTPFLKVKHAFQYKSVKDAIKHLKTIGKEIEENGLPDKIVPFNVFLMGYGHVSHGARLILEALPIEDIQPEELLAKQSELKNNKIYLTTFKEKHMVERKDDGVFTLPHYYNNPSRYKSRLENYLNYCSVYINAIYWDPHSPVFLSKTVLQTLQGKKQKLIIIGDITCDIKGSVAATVKHTWPDNPVFIYDAKTGNIADSYEGEGFAVMAVDNLPCEFPRESSDNFSAGLMPFMQSMLLNDYSKSIHDSSLPDEIKKACITHQGNLEKDYKYLKEDLK